MSLFSEKSFAAWPRSVSPTGSRESVASPLVASSNPSAFSASSAASAASTAPAASPVDTAQQQRVKAIVNSLAGFCHALGQPATVLLSSVELLRMDGIDAQTRTDVLNVCYDAVLEIKNLLSEMKNRREYLAEAYLSSTDLGGTIAAMPEWSQRMPPKNLSL